MFLKSFMMFLMACSAQGGGVSSSAIVTVTPKASQMPVARCGFTMEDLRNKTMTCLWFKNMSKFVSGKSSWTTKYVPMMAKGDKFAFMTKSRSEYLYFDYTNGVNRVLHSYMEPYPAGSFRVLQHICTGKVKPDGKQ